MADDHVLKPTQFDINKLNRSPTDQFGQTYKSDDDSSKWSDESPQSTRRYHSRSDVDLSHRSLHHTLGAKHNQASPGDHNHDGTTSKLIGPLEMDPANLGKTRPAWTLPDVYSLEDIVALLDNFTAFRLLGTGLSYIKRGQASVSFTTQSSWTQTVTFPTAYPVGTVPFVFTNISSGAGVTARWGSRSISETNANFTLFLFKGDAADAAQTWSNVNVNWLAIA